MSVLQTPGINKTANICGGAACIRDTRIAVWMIVLDRKLGMGDTEVLGSMPALTQADLDIAWDYYRANPIEIEQAIWLNDTAANVPQGVRPLAWVIVAGRLLGLSDEDIRHAFEPQLSAADVDAAWSEYRKNPREVGRALSAHRLAG